MEKYNRLISSSAQKETCCFQIEPTYRSARYPRSASDRLAAATRNYGVTCHRQVRRSCSSVEMALTPTPGEARPLPLHQLHPINLHPVVHLEHVGDGLSCVHQLTVPGPGVLGGEKILQGVAVGDLENGGAALVQKGTEPSGDLLQIGGIVGFGVGTFFPPQDLRGGGSPPWLFSGAPSPFLPGP